MTYTAELHALWIISYTGADPGFQVRGSALKKIVPSGGRHENVLGISCENIGSTHAI
jgi:hypothetical protein